MPFFYASITVFIMTMTGRSIGCLDWSAEAIDSVPPTRLITAVRFIMPLISNIGIPWRKVMRRILDTVYEKRSYIAQLRRNPPRLSTTEAGPAPSPFPRMKPSFVLRGVGRG